MRYILIDRNSGYIWGDTAQYLAGRQLPDLSIEQAAEHLDNQIDPAAAGWFTYEVTTTFDSRAVYDVYRPLEDSFPVVTDGQDPRQIEEVLQTCVFAGSVRRTQRAA